MPGGRPTEYKPDYARMVEEIIKEGGFSIPQLCKVFKVKSRSTIYDWMDDYPEFSDGVRKGRKAYDGDKIYSALKKRAVGFKYTETTRELDDDGELVVTKKVSKNVVPDVAAIKHWQVNMDQANWAERQEHEIILPKAIRIIYDDPLAEKKTDE